MDSAVRNPGVHLGYLALPNPLPKVNFNVCYNLNLSSDHEEEFLTWLFHCCHDGLGLRGTGFLRTTRELGNVASTVPISVRSTTRSAIAIAVSSPYTHLDNGNAGTGIRCGKV